ncbi:hypothetical protein QTG56_25545 (plasmid) [Rossellomorea sp. AcN35-11]|nr:hypothetical protein QTG56_25545 [Rossellomorea sp. AcN35-11]
MTWNVEEFRRSAIFKGITVPEDFIESMEYNINRSHYHSESSKEYWDSLYSTSGPNEVSVSRVAAEIETKSEFEFIAALQAIHPLADLMGQILNVTLLEDPMPIHRVDLNRVKSQLSRRPELSEVVVRISELLESEEFLFIGAFVNTIKHRNIIEVEHYGEFGQGTANRMGLRTLRFSYKNNDYDPMWVKEVLDLYIPQGNRFDLCGRK